MFAQYQVSAATVLRQRCGRPFWRPVQAALLLALVFAVAGCAAPPPLTSSDPSDPAAPTRRIGYLSTTASYVSQRPVTPGPWRQQNERVAPRPKSEQ